MYTELLSKHDNHGDDDAMGGATGGVPKLEPIDTPSIDVNKKVLPIIRAILCTGTALVYSEQNTRLVRC